MNADVKVLNQGTILVFEPLNQSAKDWIDLNVLVEPYMQIGSGFSADHRMGFAIADGMENDGLLLEAA